MPGEKELKLASTDPLNPVFGILMPEHFEPQITFVTDDYSDELIFVLRPARDLSPSGWLIIAPDDPQAPDLE